MTSGPLWLDELLEVKTGEKGGRYIDIRLRPIDSGTSKPSVSIQSGKTRPLLAKDVEALLGEVGAAAIAKLHEGGA
jgi:hypothetical protein